jgi:hypothetical protein
VPFSSSEINIEFSYLGDRDYIDISTISERTNMSLAELGILNVEQIRLRVLHPVLYNGVFEVASAESGKVVPKESPIAVDFRANSLNYTAWVKPGNTKILSRRKEIHFELAKYTFIEDQRIELRKPFNSDLVYNLMKMGRELIVHSGLGLKPRVLEFRFEFIPEAKLFSQLSLQLSPLKNALHALTCFVDDEKFGRVIVKVVE